MSLKAVIFDLDGTLYDRSHIARRLIFRELFHLRLIGSERSARKRLKGEDFCSREGFYEAFFKVISDTTGKSVPAVSKWYFDNYLPTMTDVMHRCYRAREWVKPMLARLRELGIKTAVISDYTMVPEKLKAIGLDPSDFDLVRDAPSYGGLKPCRETFEKLLSEIGFPPEDCLMVGDRDDTDGEGARRAGIPFLLVSGDSVPGILDKAGHPAHFSV